MKRYTKYKDTGVEWIGKIPEEWQVKKLKYLFSLYGGNGFPEDSQGVKEGEFPFFKVSDINGKERYVSQSVNYVSRETIEEKKWRIIPKGAILTAKIGAALLLNHRKISTKDALIDNNMFALCVNSNLLNEEYAFYITKIMDFAWFTNPGAVPSVDTYRLKNENIVFPSIRNQMLIAKYLNKQTQKIDSLIEKRKQMTELLKEQRAAIINQAVTKGINPKAKMKDLGVEWFKEIPENWNVKKLKYLLLDGKDGIKIGPFGSSLKLESIKNDGIKVYGQENVIGNDFTLGYRHIDEEKFKELSVYEIFPRDIIVTMMGTIGKAKIVPEGIKKGIMDSHLIRIRVNDKLYLPELVEILINSSHFAYSQFKMNSKGSIMEGLNSAIIKEIIVFVPSIPEQQQIVKHIESETSKINKTISQIEKEIVLIQQYKTALISEAVTGKIDLRNEVEDA